MSRSPRVLLIDNIDSFTFNVADLLHHVTGVAPTVWRHDHPVGAVGGVGQDGDSLAPWWQAFDALVVGPGPGSPMVAGDMGISREALAQRDVPVLGVCLGHQGIAHEAGRVVEPMVEPMHGRVSLVRHDGTGLFSGIPSPFEVVRYHSLSVDLLASVGAPVDPPKDLVGSAWSIDDGALMAVHDPVGRRWGVQFHPESVLTQHGALVVANFFAEAGIALPQGDGRSSPLPDAVRGEGAIRAGSTDEGAGGAAAQLDRALGDSGRAVAGDRVAMTVAARRFAGEVDAWALHEALAHLRGDELDRGGAGDGLHDSVWLDSSDQVGISVFADAAGPSAYTLRHRVGSGSDLSTGEHMPGHLLDNLDALSARIVCTDELGIDLRFDFRPGFLGYFGYEVKAETGGLAAHRSPRPDAWLIFADRAVVIEHSTGAVYAVALQTAATREAQEQWFAAVAAVVETLRTDVAAVKVPRSPVVHRDEVVCRSGRHTQAEYEALITRAQALIRAGETYEVCLTNEVTWPDEVDEVRTYAALRSMSPVPHGAWLRCGSFSVLSASPERFVSISAAGHVKAEPIKGTRARADDPRLDAAVAIELASDAKERAENLMIVDLLRNDLHRVCRAGSVEVPEMFAVRTWSTVHQLVSTITGQLADGMGPTHVLRAAFPGGSMTGAPKVRTMEIVDELEAGPRGVYSGAIGWIGVNGTMDTSIVIRTIVMDDHSRATVVSQTRTATFGIGGAITVLSAPRDEYTETLIKARGVASALTVARVCGG